MSYAKTCREISEALDDACADAEAIASTVRSVLGGEPRYDEDYKIEEWFRIRPAELARIAAALKVLRSELETEIARRA